MMHRVYLAFGTNLGNREDNILTAYKLVEDRVGRIVRHSAAISTEPEGFESDNEFLNSAACVETMLTPREVLAATQEIERDMGRRLKSVDGAYHDRIIDIDILMYDDLKVCEPDLVIPHPRMYEREFVMKPLKEIL